MLISWTKTKLSPYIEIMRLVRKSNILVFCILTIAYSIIEAFGVSMIFPILRYIESGSEIFEANQLPIYWSVIIGWIEKTGLPIGLSTLLIIAFLAVLFRQVFHILRQKYLAKLQAQFWYDMRSSTILAFMKSDLSYISGSQRGGLANVITLEAHRAGDVLISLLMIFGSFSLVLIYVLGLLLISPTLVPIVPISVIVAWVIVNRWLRLSIHYGTIASEGSDQLNASVIERLFGIRLIKLFSREHIEADYVSNISRTLGSSVAQLRSVKAFSEAIIEPIFFCGVFIILYLGVTHFNLSIASLGLFFVILIRMVPLAKEINNQRNGIAGSLTSLRNVKSTIAEAESSQTIISGDKIYSGLHSHIEFENVYFSYKNENKPQIVLTDINFKIYKGSMTAIVGVSGAGKSTLVDLLPRLQDPCQGNIYIDDIPIADYDLTSLRRGIGFVDQEVFLFNDTIRNNISYGNPSGPGDSKSIIEAAQRAFAHEFIMNQPEGYETLVGDNGIRLSSGQKQRLGIARIMFNDPDIVILDEPTSALDSVSEEYIRATIMDMQQKKTIIVIAHRLSTIQRADDILVIEDGKIVERGNHKQLLNNQGKYTQLFDLQTNISDT